MASERLTVRLPDELQSGLAVLAAATGRTESELLRVALQEYMDRHGAAKTCYDVAREAGWIGCIEGGPADLSTNPTYMEGFGRD